ncbi:MAG: hypothetical protein J5I98_12540 [Phaeodactylibacter sp.]|nr:hypothetical protein [Phaeodactylibacter sp.]
MHNASLIGLLRTLSARERTRFGHYACSPFFNRHEKVVELYSWLNGFAPAFDAEEMSRAAAWAALFPDEPYNNARLDNFISDLLQLLYGFLAYLQYERRPAAEKRLLINELLERDADKHIVRNARRARQLLLRQAGRSYEFFLEQARLEQQLDLCELNRQQRRFTAHLQQESDALDRYYWCNKLRIACDMASRNAVINAGYNCRFLEDVRKVCRESGALQEQPALHLYYQALLMLEQPQEEAHYFGLKGLLLEKPEVVTADELRTLYHYALNHCIRQINSGSGSYYAEVFRLYELMLERELLFVHGQLTEWSFKNIVTTAIRTRAFEWAERFIRQYQPFLPEDGRLNAVAYNRAALCYARAEYKQALLQLQDVEFTDTSYHLGAKIIQLKSYYELDEPEAFFALVEAFKKYLLRNREISGYRKSANAAFLNLARKIYELRLEAPGLRREALARRIGALRREVEGSQAVANKSWLVEVLEKVG